MAAKLQKSRHSSGYFSRRINYFRIYFLENLEAGTYGCIAVKQLWEQQKED
jgi:hypothetical protein